MMLWQWLDGKKTVIGSICLFADTFYSQVLQNIWGIPQIESVESTAQTLAWIGLILTGGGLTHKGVKVIEARRAQGPQP